MSLIVDLVHEWWNASPDPKTQDWLLVVPNWPLFGLLGVYLYFIKIWGPKYMENRNPWSLKTFIYCYNIFQIIANGWMALMALKLGMFDKIPLAYMKEDIITPGLQLKIAQLYWYGLISRVIDLSETVVFVLRKKDRQISFLHVYHHISVIYICYVLCRYYPSGNVLFQPWINWVVHVVMYSYYFLSSLGPDIRKMINKVKHIITIAQMTQFVAMLVHIRLLFPESCEAPKWGVTLQLINIWMNFILFFNFYIQNYRKMMSKKR